MIAPNLGTSPGMSQLSLVLQPATTELSAMRSSIRRFLTDHDEPAHDWLLIATELVTNAISVAQGSTVIDVVVNVGARRIHLRVASMGSGFDEHPETSMPTTKNRRRGLLLVHALSDRFTVETEDGRTVAVASRPRVAGRA